MLGSVQYSPGLKACVPGRQIQGSCYFEDVKVDTGLMGMTGSSLLGSWRVLDYPEREKNKDT